MKLPQWLILLGVALLAAGGAHLGVNYISFLTLAERTVADIRTATMMPPEPQDPDIVIAAITEDTLSLFPYRSPVDRQFLATLLRTLEQRHPRAIALDVLFDQETEPEKDDLLKNTIASLTVPLLVSYTDLPNIVNETQLAYLRSYLPVNVRVRADLNTDPTDGVVRWVFPGAPEPDGTYIKGFARGVVGKLGVETPDTRPDIVWHGQPDRETTPFKIFPAHAVAVLPPDWIEGKIVLVGAVESLIDRHRTPFATAYGGHAGELPGIEIHAHAVSQMLNGKQSRTPGLPLQLAMVVSLALLGVRLGSLNQGLAREMAMAGAGLALLWPGAFALFHFVGIMLPLVEPSAGFALAIWGADAITGRQARRQKEFINSAFGRYLNPQLVKQLASDPDRLQLGGETREMTMLFCDIRGFTTISEQFDAQGLTHLINRFLTPMTDIILERQGTIDKYMGDCIMAFWNAPVDDPAHAANACRAALAMQARLAPLNDELEQEAKTENRRHVPIRIGIGLNSGPVVVGNMGSNQRFDYSVLGDNVNLASRLEGQSKPYGVTIVIGENTFLLAPDFACLELDLIKVKGKTEAVRIYTLLGTPEVAASPGFLDLKARHTVMLEAYRAQDWAKARQASAACRADDGGFQLDHLYDLYDERIDDYQANPPTQPWDGVYTATSK